MCLVEKKGIESYKKWLLANENKAFERLYNLVS